MEFRPSFVRSFVRGGRRFLCTYVPTVQYSTVLLYMSSKQIHEEDHGHKMGHAPRALHGELIYGHLKAVLELSVGLSFDQRQAQWRIDLFWQQLQALSARPCRSLARNLHSSGYTQSTCSQGGGPCEGFEKRWRTTTTSVRGV